jgi:hypothetical protein
LPNLTTADYTEDSIHTLYLNNTEALNAKTGSVTLNGYVSYAAIADYNTQSRSIIADGSDGLSLTVNRDTGAISGSILPWSDNSGAQYNIQLNGTLTNHTSSYISDDNFGVMVDSGTFAGDNYIANSGFLVSRPDTFDFTGADSTLVAVSENSSDYSSWGYWTSSFTDGTTNNLSVIDARSAWVAGELTNASSLTDLAAKAGTSTPTFTGHIIGAVMDTTGLNEHIILNSANQVNLNFNLSAGTVTGNIAFATTHTSWSETIASGTTAATATNFSFATTNANGGGGVGTGTYYGPNMNSVGGAFKTTQTVNSIVQSAGGVFKAVKN